MCIIIAKPAGVDPLDKEYFKRAWEANPQGGGVIFKEDGKPTKFKKGMMVKEDFLGMLELVNEKNTSFVAHFRIASKGEVKPENTHPFIYNRISLAHNGTLAITPTEGKTDSETFGDTYLHDKDITWVKKYQALLEAYLGTSKFAIMDNVTGEILILNKRLGEEKDGAWFSNSGAFKPKIYSYPKNYNYNKYDDLDDGYGHKGYNFLPKPDSEFKPQINFSTKKFHKEFGLYDKQQGVWIYATSRVKIPVYEYGTKLCLSKKGLYFLDPSIMPDEKLPNKTYDKKDEIHSVLKEFQFKRNILLNKYLSKGYKTKDARTEVEEQIHAHYAVCNAVQRLIKAGKEVSTESLVDFLVQNIKPGKDAQERSVMYYTFDSYVDDFIDEFMKDLDMEDPANENELPL